MTKHSKKLLSILSFAALGTIPLRAVDLSDIAIHGSASYTESSSDKYNFYGNTSNDKFDNNIEEITINGGYKWASGLRLSAQIYGADVDDYTSLDLDFLSLDYQFNPEFGIRLGRNKSTLALYGDSQDLDQVRTFANLPFGFYPRNTRTLNYTDGITFYGSIPAGRAGSFDYTVYGGRIEKVPDDALIARSGGGLTVTDQFTIPIAVGATVAWNTPVEGLRFVASGLDLPHIGIMAHLADKAFATRPGLGYSSTPLIIDGAYGNGTWDYAFAGSSANSSLTLHEYTASAEYTLNKWVFAYELKMEPEHINANIPVLGVKNNYSVTMELDTYLSATYQATKKIGLGAYYGYTDTDFHKNSATPNYARTMGDAAAVVAYAPLSWWVFKVEFHELNGLALLENAGDLNPNASYANRKWNYLSVKTTLSF